jgi:DNA polymerase-3 subunit delta'
MFSSDKRKNQKMEIRQLQTLEPKFYSIIQNSFLANKLNHAYLLVGPANSPLLDCSIYLAQKIICLEDACQTCYACKQIANLTYPDLMYLDANSETVNKQSISEIETNLSKSAKMKANKQLYLITNLEKVKEDALNSLLKFLEEPNENVFAIFTSTNLEAILPTIVSRCNVIKLAPLSKDYISTSLLEKNVDPTILPFLLDFPLNIDQLASFSQSAEFLLALKLITELIDVLGTNKEEILLWSFNYTKQISKDVISAFFHLLILLLKDLNYLSFGLKVATFSSNLDKLSQINGKVRAIDGKIRAIGQLWTRVNDSAIMSLVWNKCFLILTR